MNMSELRKIRRLVDQAYERTRYDSPNDPIYDRKFNELTDEEIELIIPEIISQIKSSDRNIFTGGGYCSKHGYGFEINIAKILYPNAEELAEYHREEMEKLHDDMLDIIHGKPSDEDLEKVMEYISTRNYDIKCA